VAVDATDQGRAGGSDALIRKASPIVRSPSVRPPVEPPRPPNHSAIESCGSALWIAHGLADRFSYRVAVAEKLPFADASFDLVTCQTVLIHMPDPGAAVDEMVRVARPGGLILAAEPNNVSRALMFDSVSFHDPVDEILARARLQLICERGKAALGEGNNSIGDLVPSLFAERDLVDVCVYVNDKADILVPPYDSPAQRATLEERADFKHRGFWSGWSREDTR
jgi:SAM-dependent methyltransferase